MVVVEIPMPDSILALTWFLLGFTFARQFGKKFDYEVQQTEWFKKLPSFWQWFVKCLLDFTHHWWIGLLLMCYAHLTPFPIEIFWFGCGMFIDDLPDVPRRFRKLFKIPWAR